MNGIHTWKMMIEIHTRKKAHRCRLINLLYCDLAFRMPLHDYNIKQSWPVPCCFSLVARGDEALRVLHAGFGFDPSQHPLLPYSFCNDSPDHPSFRRPVKPFEE